VDTDNDVYLNPQDSSATFCNTVDVEVWVDATGFQGGQIKLLYDSTCGDVTNWERNDDVFPLGTWESATPGEEWITFTATSPLSGVYLIGTLTIHGLCEMGGCSTTLDFVEPSKLFDQFGSEIAANWVDGTFECGDGGHPPVANDDTYNTNKNTTLNVPAPGVLSNDSDPDGDSIIAIPVTNPSDGTLDLNSDGSFTYTPDTDFSGSDSFTYKANDGSLDSNTATVTIEVTDTYNEVYLDPQHSSAPFCNTVAVEVWVGAADFQGGQIKLLYDSTCGDVENWERNEDVFPLGTWESTTPGEEWITFTATSPMSGDYLIGTLTIHGLCEMGACSTILDFVDPSKLFDQFGSEIASSWVDGTFECDGVGPSWTVPMAADAGPEGMNGDLEFGIYPDATDGYDSGIDLPHPPPGPTPPPFEAYFSIDDMLFPRLNKDFRGATPNEWTLEVRSTDQAIELTWDASEIPPELYAFMDTGTEMIDMRAQNSVPPLSPGEHTIKISVSEMIPIQLSLKAGWNLVSVPVIPADTSVGTVFAGTEVVYAWDADTGTYYFPTEVDPCRGYWVAVISDTVITVTGVPVSCLTCEVKAGFNLIGSVICSLDFSAPDTDPAGKVEGFSYRWDHDHYIFSTTVEPGMGHWIAATEDCLLTLCCDA
jgi:hypothetical protein